MSCMSLKVIVLTPDQGGLPSRYRDAGAPAELEEHGQKQVFEIRTHGIFDEIESASHLLSILKAGEMRSFLFVLIAKVRRIIMNAKRIVPLVVGGILSAGAAVVSCSEFRRLKRIISLHEQIDENNREIIEAQRKAIEKDEDVIACQKNLIKSQNDVEESMKKIIENDKQIIDIQKEMISIARGNTVTDEAAALNEQPVILPEEPSVEVTSSRTVPQNKPRYIFQYDSDLNLVGKYKTVTEAARAAGVNHYSSINKVLRGASISAGGYFWSKGERPLKKFPDKGVKLSQRKKT